MAGEFAYLAQTAAGLEFHEELIEIGLLAEDGCDGRRDVTIDHSILGAGRDRRIVEKTAHRNLNGFARSRAHSQELVLDRAEQSSAGLLDQDSVVLRGPGTVVFVHQ